MPDDATALAEAIRKDRLNASGAMQAALERAEQMDRLGAIVHLEAEAGLEAARAIDARLAQADERLASVPFAGVPSLVKDLGGPFAGLPVAAGSRMLSRGNENCPDSDLAARMRAAGLCFFGLTTVPEMGLSLSCEPAAGPICRNPLDPLRTPGGSSGGAAAAVAAGVVAIAHATDAGGSIRVPAACCGLLGMKATRGAMPAGPGFGNHLGGIAGELAVCRSSRDLATIFEAVFGGVRGPFADPELAPVKRGTLRIGLLAETGNDHSTDPSRSEAVEAAARSLEKDGHTVVSLGWRDFVGPVAASAIALRDIIAVNLASYVAGARLDAELAEPLTGAFIRRGVAMTGGELWSALDGAVRASRSFWDIFEDLDLLVAPMLATAPRPLGSFPFDHGDPDLQIRRMTDFAPLAALANITGFPALTLPFGADAEGLPLPVQLIAPMGHDRLLLHLAGRLEKEDRWQHRYRVAGLNS
ncbi:amidase [Rhizobium petrolearium]|uniref:amidase n=1 Tax=Neorhizobium petrolearium TaxID=515361 RepID=UPI001AE9C3AE|nr:amidase [Neorhizobium petrolearium]MBP1843405.1 amidase [Neorhizobium petrolearium]